jgi:hypothetical protein
MLTNFRVEETPDKMPYSADLHSVHTLRQRDTPIPVGFVWLTD